MAKSVRLEPSKPGHVRFRIGAEIRDDRYRWLSFEVVADVEPRLIDSQEGKVLELHFGAEDLISARPQFPKNAATQLADLIAQRIRGGVAKRLPRALLDSATARFLKHLTTRGFESLRARLYDRLGTVALIRWRLPEVPIASVSVRSSRRAAALSVDITTTLPISKGIAAASTEPLGELSATTSPEAALAIANWLIDTGKAPRTYTRNLKPHPAGRYRPFFAWNRSDQERPLKVHILRETEPCAYLRVGVRPSARLTGDQLIIKLDNRRIEAALGPVSLELGARLANLLNLSMEKTRTASSMSVVSFGPLSYLVAAKDVDIDEESFRFALDAVLDPAPRATAR